MADDGLVEYIGTPWSELLKKAEFVNSPCMSYLQYYVVLSDLV